MSETKQTDQSETAFYTLVIAALEALYIDYTNEIEDRITVNIDDDGALSANINSEISRMRAVAAEADEAINRLLGLADRARARANGAALHHDDPGSGLPA